MTLTPLAALLGGVLTVFAPCSVMILPAFFAYAFQSRSALLLRTGIFWLGLLTSLLPLGALVGAAGSALRDHLDLITRICAFIIIILGIVEIIALEIPTPHRKASAGVRKERDRTHPLSIYLLGLTYGFAGIGCAGPILGAVLVAAGIGGSPATGAALMALYATGMVVPLAVLALAWQSTNLSSSTWLRPRPLRLFGRDTTWTNVISGIVLVALGTTLLIAGIANPLGGLISATTLASWEQSLLRFGSTIPTWAMITVVILVIAAAWFAWPRRTKETETNAA